MFVIFIALAIYLTGVASASTPGILGQPLGSIVTVIMLLSFVAVVDLWYWYISRKLKRIEKLILESRESKVVRNFTLETNDSKKGTLK